MKKITYEVHAQSKRRWNLERVYEGDQRETAIEHARMLYAERHIEGAKVICAKLDDETGDSSDSVVFDTTRNMEKVQVRTAAPANAGGATAQPAAAGGAPAPRAAAAPGIRVKGPSMVGITVLSVVLITAVAVLAVVANRAEEVLQALG